MRTETCVKVVNLQYLQLQTQHHTTTSTQPHEVAFPMLDHLNLQPPLKNTHNHKPTADNTIPQKSRDMVLQITIHTMTKMTMMTMTAADSISSCHSRKTQRYYTTHTKFNDPQKLC